MAKTLLGYPAVAQSQDNPSAGQGVRQQDPLELQAAGSPGMTIMPTVLGQLHRSRGSMLQAGSEVVTENPSYKLLHGPVGAGSHRHLWRYSHSF